MSETIDPTSNPSHPEEDISAALDSVSQKKAGVCPMKPALYRLISASQWIERNPLPMLMLLAASATCGLACIYFGLTVLLGGLFAILFLRDEGAPDTMEPGFPSQGDHSKS